METFVSARDFVAHPGYIDARRRTIAKLELNSVDSPIRDIIEGFTSLSYCFTLQCCYGHFIWSENQHRHSLQSLPPGYTGSVTYRIADITFCLEESDQGRMFRNSLSRLQATDPESIQFGSADWFWERCVNSYVLQVQPKAHIKMDKAILDCAVAQHTQSVRDQFFKKLRVLLSTQPGIESKPV